jgi:hypothetical protein
MTFASIAEAEGAGYLVLLHTISTRAPISPTANGE